MSELQKMIAAEEQKLRELRKVERSVRGQMQAQGSASGSGLKSKLSSVLPINLVPSNVGDVSEVMWPFSIPVSFTYSAGFTFGATQNIQRANIQNTQDAWFIVTAISRDCNDQGVFGARGPWQLELQDRQSSRNFQSTAIPLQQIGYKGVPTTLPVAFVLAPNSFLDVTMSSWFTTGSNAAASDVNHEFRFYGYKQRVV